MPARAARRSGSADAEDFIGWTVGSIVYDGIVFSAVLFVSRKTGIASGPKLPPFGVCGGSRRPTTHGCKAVDSYGDLATQSYLGT